MLILAIETSCDETAVAVLKGSGNRLDVLSSVVSSQTKLHARWGGVVPNLAAREHLKNAIPLLELALERSGVSSGNIHLVAVTKGPGLIPALLIGGSVAKTLSWIWKKPMLGINHIEGHIYSNFVRGAESRKSKIESGKIKFPVLCLIVSGGHTQLVVARGHFDYKIVGQTLDDAAGEAFDKVARILGLGYPGGPAIAACAEKFKIKKLKLKIGLPRPMINSNNFDFSFSGLKTAVLYAVKKFKSAEIEKLKPEICHEFQQSIIDVLISKSVAAGKKFRPKTIMMAGGVSANKELRRQFRKAIKLNFSKSAYVQPHPKYSVDNAVMIGAAAYYRWKSLDSRQRSASLQNWKKIQTDANLKLR